MPACLQFGRAAWWLALVWLAWSTTATAVTTPLSITEYSQGLSAGYLPGGHVTLGPDGAVWFTESLRNKIGRIPAGSNGASAGVITEYTASQNSTNSGPEGITVGPDGALWFTESNANQVGRMDPVSGIVTNEYPVGVEPWGITVGPDGALWFAELGAAKIGRIDTRGNYSESAMISSGAQPYHITLGPDGNLWFTDLAGAIGRITPAMTITEFGGLPYEGPYTITAGPDGNLWFTEFNNDLIGTITTAGVILNQFSTSSGSFPAGITTGPDGNLWFTETNSGKIGRITTAGTVSEFPIPFSGASPEELTVGPDGALWFVDAIGAIGRAVLPAKPPTILVYPTLFGADGYYPYLTTLGPDNAIWFTDVNDYIGRATTQGSVTEYPIPTAGVVPEGIAVGLDGNLWFTEFTGGDKIGRIAPGGVITEYRLPNTGSEPVSIVSGPDGALWFTEAAGRIGRIDLMGNLTEYPLPTSIGGPQGITVGPDGALWFTEQAVGQIARITTSGMVTEFNTLPMGAAPLMIASGPDLALWFTDPGNNKIGRITTLGVVTEYSVPTMNSFPFGIVLGPDGAIWFAEQTANNVGRVDPMTYEITEYSIEPLGQNQPWGGIVSGPDGALWFTDGSSVGGIARLAATVTGDTATVKIIATNPSGLTVNVDGTNYTAPVSFTWPNGSLHTLDAVVPASSGTIEYSFSGWSDGKPQSHTISAGPAPTVYVANINRQYEFTSTISPAGSGSVIPASGTFFSAGTTVQVTAQANQGYYFNNWGSGSLSGSANPQSLVINAPVTVAANFAACPVITISSLPPAPLPNATVGTLYSVSFSATGGVGSYTYSATGVPTWAAFAANVFSGTPVTTGTGSITVTATDSNGCAGNVTDGFTISAATVGPAVVTDTETITVIDTPSFPDMETIHVMDTPLIIAFSPISISPQTIPGGTGGVAYGPVQFTIVGGVGAITFTEMGSLPNGITFSNGALSGNTTVTGSFPLTITATDSIGNMVSEGLTLAIAPATLGPATVTDTETITVIDTPSFPDMETIHVMDTPLIIAFSPISISPQTIPGGTGGVAYGPVQFTTMGGVGPITFTEMGPLPNGITFSNGALSGSTTVTGSFPITITATDSIGNMVSEGLTLAISPATLGPATVTDTETITVIDTPSFPDMETIHVKDTPTVIAFSPIVISPQTLPHATAGLAYGPIQFTASGGVSPITFTETGALPTGFTFSKATLGGKTNVTGSFPIIVTAKDAIGNTVRDFLTLVVTSVTVPNVVGLTEVAATAAIQDAGLVVGAVNSAYSSTMSLGNVISETPAAGAQVLGGSAVNLLVSSELLINETIGVTDAPSPSDNPVSESIKVTDTVVVTPP